jgi:hypothetical protein
MLTTSGWNSQDGSSGGRTRDAATSLRFLAYRLDCVDHIEPGDGQRTMIAAIRSEAASVLEVLATAAVRQH